MKIVAINTKLKTESIAEYEKIHKVIPENLAQAICDAGVKEWKIWRSGENLFHTIECDNWSEVQSFLANHEANLPWQEKINKLLSNSDHSEIKQVWSLQDQLGNAGAGS